VQHRPPRESTAGRSGPVDEDEVGRLGLELRKHLGGEVECVDASAGDLLWHQRPVVDGCELAEAELLDERTGFSAEIRLFFHGDHSRPGTIWRVLAHIAREADRAQAAPELEDAPRRPFPDLALEQIHCLGGDRPVTEVPLGEASRKPGICQGRALPDQRRGSEREDVRPAAEAPQA
jgi:hypothetical protein